MDTQAAVSLSIWPSVCANLQGCCRTPDWLFGKLLRTYVPAHGKHCDWLPYDQRMPWPAGSLLATRSSQTRVHSSSACPGLPFLCRAQAAVHCSFGSYLGLQLCSHMTLLDWLAFDLHVPLTCRFIAGHKKLSDWLFASLICLPALPLSWWLWHLNLYKGAIRDTGFRWAQQQSLQALVVVSAILGG